MVTQNMVARSMIARAIVAQAMVARSMIAQAIVARAMVARAMVLESLPYIYIGHNRDIIEKDSTWNLLSCFNVIAIYGILLGLITI